VAFAFGALLLIFRLIASTYPARFKKQIKFPLQATNATASHRTTHRATHRTTR